MRKLIMWNVVTLDGCFEGEKKWDLEFHQLVWGPELEKLGIEQLKSADMLVFGNVTYEGMAKYWVAAEGTDEGEVAGFMNNIKKVVCSKTREKADWNNTVIAKDAITEIRKLKEEGDRPMLVFGSGILSQSLMNAGLFDEIRLCVAPVILGKGRQLFSKENQKQNLRLIQSQTLPNGGMILKYDVVKN
jgi:dihydrofolate reductase